MGEPLVTQDPVGRLVIYSQVHGYRIRSAADGRVLRTIRLQPGEQAVTRPIAAAGNTRFLIVTGKGPKRESDRRPETVQVRAFDAATCEPVWDWNLPAPDAVKLIPFPDNSRADLATPPILVNLLSAHLAPDGKRFAVVPNRMKFGQKISILDTANGRLVRELDVPDEWTQPNPTVTLGSGGQVVFQDVRRSFVWDAASPEPRLELKGITWQSTRPVFSRDGRRLFAIDNYDNAASGRVVRVWCMETGRELMWFPVPTPPLSGRRLDRSLSMVGDKLFVQMADGVRKARRYATSGAGEMTGRHPPLGRRPPRRHPNEGTEVAACPIGEKAVTGVRRG